MDRPLAIICYATAALLIFGVVLDAIDDLAFGNRWAGATPALAGLATACLTALVTYRRRRNGGGRSGGGEKRDVSDR